MKKLFFSFICILVIVVLCCQIFNMSYAYSYDVDTSVLFYKEDINELSSDIKKYIENIDDLIIFNSTFLYSDILTENYDFLIYFAADYILKNHNYYNDEIIKFDNCKYNNYLGIEKSTSDYVSLNTI